MSRPERQQNVLDLLEGLRGIEPLKNSSNSFGRNSITNASTSRFPGAVGRNRRARLWRMIRCCSRAAARTMLFTSFIAGSRPTTLARALERPVVTQLLREHPYALFVFSNKGQTDWHFLNVKFDDQAERRRLFRRITVRPGAGLRTATERVQLLDLAEIHPELFGITPLAIQQCCDAAFDVEAVTKDFFSEIANWYFWALKNVRNFPKTRPRKPTATTTSASSASSRASSFAGS